MRVIRFLMLITLAAVMCCGCAASSKPLLDPTRPVQITIWHYHNSNNQENFEKMVNEFNRTDGAEQGVIVNTVASGSIDQTANSVYDAVLGKIGASRPPDLFFAYPRHAYEADKIAALADFREYFTPDELETYNRDFLGDGYAEDGRLILFPVSKSSSVLFVNKNDWELFAEETGETLDALATWDGIVETAPKYSGWAYEKYGERRAFFSIDSVFQFASIYAEQMGFELYSETDNGGITLDPRVAQRVWELFCVPYLKGDLSAINEYGSDDARLGLCVCYAGSSAGASFFPSNVIRSATQNYRIEPLVMPFPLHEGGQAVAPLRGAGICMLKSDEAHEYAASIFLRWFTQAQRNCEFAVSTGYLPVKAEALQSDLIAETRFVPATQANSAAVELTMQTLLDMLPSYRFYSRPPSEKTSSAETVIDETTYAALGAWRDKIGSAVSQSERDELILQYTSDEAFDEWYSLIQENLRA